MNPRSGRDALKSCSEHPCTRARYTPIRSIVSIYGLSVHRFEDWVRFGRDGAARWGRGSAPGPRSIKCEYQRTQSFAHRGRDPARHSNPKFREIVAERNRRAEIASGEKL